LAAHAHRKIVILFEPRGDQDRCKRSESGMHSSLLLSAALPALRRRCEKSNVEARNAEE
jgi:hypothetical protein